MVPPYLGNRIPLMLAFFAIYLAVLRAARFPCFQNIGVLWAALEDRLPKLFPKTECTILPNILLILTSAGQTRAPFPTRIRKKDRCLRLIYRHFS